MRVHYEGQVAPEARPGRLDQGRTESDGPGLQVIRALVSALTRAIAAIALLLATVTVALASPGCAAINSGIMNYTGVSKTAHLGVTLDAFYPGDQLFLSYTTNAPKAGVILTLTLTSISVNTVITGATNTTHTLSATMGALLPIGVEAGITDATALLSPRNVVFTVTCTPGLIPTTLTLASATNPSVYGQQASLNATLTSPEGTPTGNVVFTVDGVAQPPVAIVNGVAPLNLAGLSVGMHTVSASYAGTASFGPSSASLFGWQTVNKASTTTSIGSSNATSAFGETVTFTATTSATAPGGGVPSGSMIFTIDGVDQSPVTLSNGTATFATSALSVGAHVVAARYVASASHNASATTLTGGQTIGKANTTTVITKSAPSTVAGQSVTFTATVASVGGTPTGTVTFTVDGVAQTPVALSGGVATYATSALAVGTHSVSAAYSGSTNYNTSSGTLSGGHAVTLVPTTTAVTGPGAVTFGTDPTISISVTASGGTPTGTVTPVVDGIARDAVALSNGTANVALTGLSAGPHTVSVLYSGSATHAASTGTLTGGQTVGQATTTTTIAPVSVAVGGNIDLDATVASTGGTPTGAVVFTVDGVAQPPVSLASGHARLRLTGLAVGTYPVTADFAGSTNFAASSGSGSITIGQATPTVTVASAANPSVAGQPISFTATVSSSAGTPTGTVVFSVDGVAQPAATLVAGQAVFLSPALSVGTHTVTAAYSGDTSFAAASGSLAGNQVTNRASAQLDVSTLTSTIPAGAPATVTATVHAVAPGVGVPTGNVVFTVDGVAQAPVALSGGVADLVLPALAVGTHTISAAYAGDTNFGAASGSLAGDLTVSAGATTMSLSSNAPVAYGSPVTLTATLLSMSGTPDGTIEFSVDGVAQTPVTLVGGTASLQVANLEPGTHAVTAHYSGSVNHQPIDGTLAGGVVVTTATTTFELAASAPSPTFGQMLTVTASLGTPAATGTVVFTVDGVARPAAAVVAGTAILDLTGLGAGPHTVSAVYSGDTHYASASATLPALTIGAATTSATLTADPAAPVYGESIDLEFTVSSSGGTPAGNAVFTIDGVVADTVPLVNGVAELTVNGLGVGPHVIAATYAAQGNFGASSASVSGGIAVTIADTETVVTGPATPVSLGQPARFTATVTSDTADPIGTVVFIIDGVSLAPQPLVNGVAEVDIVFQAAGSHTVSATFIGTASLSTSSDSLDVPFVVDAAATTTTFSIPTTSTFGASVVATANVTSTAGTPTGTVNLVVDGNVVDSTTLANGEAVFVLTPLTPGGHTVSVSYAGTANFLASAATDETLTINAATTTTTVTASDTSITEGETVTFTVTVVSPNGPATGTVTVSINGNDYPGTLVNGVASVDVSDLTPGTHPVTVTYDGNAGFSTSTTTLAVDIVVVPAQTDVEVTLDLPRGIVGEVYDGAIIASGGVGPYSFAVTGGALPNGLTLDPVTGEVTGTPTQDGQFAVQITVSAVAGASAIVNVTFDVVPPTIVILPPTLPAGVFGVPYNQSLAASGGTSPYTYAVASGSLPTGLSLNASTGRISGTPTQLGTATFDVRATDADGFAGQVSYQLVVAAPTITVGGTLPRAAENSPFLATITASGGTAPYTFAVLGTLPSGLTLASDGTLSGTPTNAGDYDFSIVATDANGFTGQFDVSLEVEVPPAQIELTDVADARQNQAYSDWTLAVGGAAPYTYAVTTGSLPAGLTLDADGHLHGTPTGSGTVSFEVTATDANGATGSRTFSFDVAAAAVITITPTVPPVTAGEDYSETIAVSGGTAPYTYAIVSGSLPAGLTLDPNTGDISGTAQTPGTYPVGIRVTDANGDTGTAQITIVVAAPTIAVTVTVADSTFGEPVIGSVVVTGGLTPYSYAVTGGALPAGVVLNPLTGIISGTADEAGTFTATVTVTDLNGFTGQGLVTFEIDPPDISMLPLVNNHVVLGMPFSQAIQVTGGQPPYAFSITSGSLPTGLSLNQSTGLISGTALSLGTSTFTVTATDDDGFSVSGSYSITVDTNVGTLLLPTSIPDATAGIPYSASIAALNGNAGLVTYAISVGSLPPGFSLNQQTGRLSGTTTVTGDFTFTVLAISVGGLINLQSYTLTVLEPTITATSQPGPGVAGSPYTAQLTATGGASPYTFAVSQGSLPVGLTLAANGQITGTPTEDGTFPVTVTITDANGYSDDAAFTFTIQAPSIVLGGTLPAGRVGVAYTGSLSVSGGASPYVFAVTAGSLPGGLSLDPATGAVTGTPTADATGSVTISVTDANGYSDERTFAYVIASNVGTAILPTDVDPAVSGVLYSDSLAATGGTAPYTYAVTSGSLPPGITLDPATGDLTGTPTVVGEYDFTITVTDNNGLINTGTYQLIVAEPDPVIVLPGVIPTATVGQPFTMTITVQDGTQPITFELTGEPDGISIDPTTGVISGTPTDPGTYTVTVTVRDGRGRVVTDTLTIVVDPAPVTLLLPTTVPDAVEGQGYLASVEASNAVVPVTYSVSAGALPTGLTLDTSTGLISGTPTVTGIFNFTIDAIDADTNTGSQAYTLNVQPAQPAIEVTVTGLSTQTTSISIGRPLHVTVTVATAGGRADAGTVSIRDVSSGTVLASGSVNVNGTVTFDVPLPAIGQYTLVAEYAGTVDFAASQSSPLTVTVDPAATSIGLSGALTVPAGTPVSLTATVARVAPALGQPSGDVTFTVDGVVHSTVAVSNGTAVFTATLPPGQHQIVADFQGTDPTDGSSTATATITVTATTTTSLSLPSGQVVEGQTANLVATVTPSASGVAMTGSVTFTDNGQVIGTVALTNGVATLSLPAAGLGIHTIVASYAGDGIYQASISAPGTYEVIASGVILLPTTTTVGASDTTPAPGDTVTLSVSVSTGTTTIPGGTITFTDDTNTVLGTATLDGQGQATFTYIATSAQRTITATYSGDVACQASSGTVVIIPTAAEATTLSLVASAPTVVSGGTVTLTATATRTANGIAATGTVSFFADGVLIGTVAVGGNGVATIVSGAITADTTFTAEFTPASPAELASTATPIVVTLDTTGREASTTIVVPSDPTPEVGQSITLTATVAGVTLIPTGTVTFTDGNGNVIGTAQLDGQGQATVTYVPTTGGSITVVATYGGDSGVLPSSGTTTVITSPAVQTTTTLSASAPTVATGGTVALTATTTRNSDSAPATGTVTFLADGVGFATITLGAGGTASTVSAPISADTIFTATFAPAGLNELASTSPGVTVTLDQSGLAPTTTSIAASSTTPQVGDTITLTVTVSTGTQLIPTGTVAIADGNGAALGTVTLDAQGQGTLTLPIGSATPISVIATYGGDSATLPSAGQLAINPVGSPLATEIALTASATTVTAGQAVTLTAVATRTSDGSPATGTIAFLADGVVFASAATDGNGGASVPTAPVIGQTTFTATFTAANGSGLLDSASAPVVVGLQRLVPTVDVWAQREDDAGGYLQITVIPPQGVTVIPTGTIVLSVGAWPDQTLPLVNGVATLTYPAHTFTGENLTFTAVYSGDTIYEPATGTTEWDATELMPTTIDLQLSDYQIVPGEDITATAWVTSAAEVEGGTVVFEVDGVAWAEATVIDGMATAILSNLPVETLEIYAYYEGDEDFGPSRSTLDLVTLETGLQGTLTIALTADDEALFSVGQSILISATVSAVDGPVSGIAVTSSPVTLTCPMTELAEGQSMVCEGTYVVTAVDLETGVTFAATASGANTAAVSAQLVLQSAVGLVQDTFTSLTNQFLTTRARLVGDAIPLPDILSRRQAASRPGTVEMSLEDASQVLAFATSLREWHDWMAQQGGDAAALGALEESPAFNVWIDARMALHAETEGGGHWGNASTVAVGADYLVTENILAGLMFQGDRTVDKSADSSVVGDGFLIGPYVSIALGDNLAFDATVLTGRSSNTASSTMLGETFVGDFDTDRIYAKAALTGFFTMDALTVRPNATFMLISERAGAYNVVNADGDSVSIGGTDLLEYRLSVGGTAEYDILLEDGATLRPSFGAEVGLVGDVQPDSNEQQILGKLMLGLDYETDSGFTIGVGLSTQVDTGGFKSGAIKLSVSGRF